MSYFYTPWKRHKTYGFLTFSGVIDIGLKWVNYEITRQTQPTFTCSKSTMETQEQCLKSAQS